MTTRQKRVGIVAHQESFSDSDGDKLLHFVAATPYVKAVQRAGGIPLILPVVDIADVESLLDSVDALVITGGCDVDPSSYGADPTPLLGATSVERDRTDIAFVHAAVQRNFPTLGICRGIQVLNVALGGTLTQHVDAHMRLDAYNQHVHRVRIDDDSQLFTILGVTEIGVNTLHHQVIDQLAKTARATAHNEDGHVEAIEVSGASNVNAVQWHPELLRHEPHHLALFQHLLR